MFLIVCVVRSVQRWISRSCLHGAHPTRSDSQRISLREEGQSEHGTTTEETESNPGAHEQTDQLTEADETDRQIGLKRNWIKEDKQNDSLDKELNWNDR